MVQDEPDRDDVLVGRWPLDTAIGVISALEDAGIRPRAQRTGASVEVYVRDDERLHAHRVLAPVGASPDEGTAEPPRPDGVERPPPPDGIRRPPSADDGRPLLAERMRRLGRPLALLLAVLIAITLSYQGPVIGAIAVAVAVGAVALWLRNHVRGDDDDHTYGPGSS